MRRIRDDEIDDILAQTRSRYPKQRGEALRQLCPCHLRRNVPKVWERVFQMVEDPEPRVRSNVLHLLADGSPRDYEERVVTAVEGLTHDSDRKVRRQARRLISHYRHTGQINIL